MHFVIETDLISSKRFLFGRIGENPYTGDFVFGPDGLVQGYRNRNEEKWRVQDGSIVLIDADGGPTRIFDQVVYNNGIFSFHGRSVEDSTYSHILTENRPEVRSPASVAVEAPRSKQTKNSLAVLVRSHKCDEKFVELMEKLRRHQNGFDLYPIVDETKGRPVTDERDVIWHSANACREIGLTQKHQALFIVCGDFPFYFALREIPDYRHYLMIEDDVDLTRPDSGFISEIAERLVSRSETDFVGLQFGKMVPQSGWYPACHKVFPDRVCYNAYFPFVILSKKAISYLFSQRLIEAWKRPEPNDIIHCEAFVASAVVAGGFNAVHLEDFRAGAYKFETMAMQVGHESMGYPMGYDFPTDNVEMVHPIYSHSEYVQRAYQKYILGRGADWDALVNELEGHRAKSVPEAMRREMCLRRPS